MSILFHCLPLPWWTSYDNIQLQKDLQQQAFRSTWRLALFSGQEFHSAQSLSKPSHWGTHKTLPSLTLWTHAQVHTGTLDPDVEWDRVTAADMGRLSCKHIPASTVFWSNHAAVRLTIRNIFEFIKLNYPTCQKRKQRQCWLFCLVSISIASLKSAFEWGFFGPNIKCSQTANACFDPHTFRLLLQPHALKDVVANTSLHNWQSLTCTAKSC